MAGRLPRARATRTFSRAVAGSRPIRQRNNRQPMRARHGPLGCPAALGIELANTFKQPVRGRVQVNRQFRNFLPQFLDGKHGWNYTLVQL
jgi:hypothetical protein